MGAPAFAQSQRDIQTMVVDEALNSRVPPSLALAVARVESNFNARALSPAGARGVMQLMPKTARDVFGVRQEQLYNARLNIQLGIDFLEQLYMQYGRRWDLALSHYNGGTLEGGAGADAVPHSYTRKYVADVLRWQKFFADPLRWRPLASRTPPVRALVATSREQTVAAASREWFDIGRRRDLLRRGVDDFKGRSLE